MKKLVIGILAHVDSGKTTLSEGMLYCCGEIRRLGRVDHRDSFLDTNEIERERGITIFSKQAVMSFGDSEIFLLDTPGHTDFSAETERTLGVLDYAILIISGSEGVQSHTETLWSLLSRYDIPTFLFVNKMDLAGADRSEIMSEIKKKLDDCCVDFSFGDFEEELAVCDDTLTERYLERQSLSDNEIISAIMSRKVFPVYFGSALRTDGVEEFLKGIDRYTEAIEYGSEFGARVFKITEDERGERLTHMKITGGSLTVKDLICGKNADGTKWSEKVNQIRIYSGEKFKTVNEAAAGEVCAVTGLKSTYTGEGLGFEVNLKNLVLEPAFSYKIKLPPEVHPSDAIIKLKRLEEEETQLHILWDSRLEEISIRLMGDVQLEVLKRIIAQRFNMLVEFEQGSVIYKETIADSVEGVGHYEPLRHYAEVHLLLEPAKRGSGLIISSDCPEDDLDRNWQRLILTHLKEKTHIGVLTGAPITDMKITLVAGRAHKKHTEGGDFRQATYRAVRHGLMNAQSILLEPWYDFKLEVQNDAVGRAMNDINLMGGSFLQPEVSGDMSVIKGSAPVAAMNGYQREVTAYTRGHGKLICMFKGYEPCQNSDEVIEKIGYNPENDTENPADSIFCSHGSGTLVKWSDVYEHMHIAGINDRKADEINTPEVRARITEYVNSIEGDKELLRIFENTYGKVKRKNYNTMRTVKLPLVQQPVRTPHKKAMPQGAEYLLVDGYNIIFAWDELNAVAQENMDMARNMLITRLANFQAVKGCELILVFDAYKVSGNVREIERVNNISIVYTKEAETADAYIEKVTHELVKKHRVRVATSDGLEQVIILGNGALRISASAFLGEVEAAEETIKNIIEGGI